MNKLIPELSKQLDRASNVLGECLVASPIWWKKGKGVIIR
jgi:hypothetical protein